MAKIKMYKFKDGSAFTHNGKIVEAIGDAAHVRQVAVVTAATSKKAALEFLNAVGLGINAREAHLALSDSPRHAKLIEDGVLTEGTVLVSSLIPRNGSTIVSLTPTDDKYDPQITPVTTA